MPKHTVVSATTDGLVYGQHANYATAHGSAYARDGDGTTLRVGQRVSSGNYYVYRGYLRFDATLPAGATLLGAVLTLTMQSTSATEAVDIYAVPCDWSAYEPLTNDNKQAAFEAARDAVTPASLWANTASLAANTPHSGALSAALLQAINTAGPTYLALRCSTDLAQSTPAANQYVTLYAADEATAAYRPTLTLYYTEGDVLLEERFTTDEAAPIASPRECEPGPGLLAVTDADGLLSIAGGRLLVDDQDAGSWTDTVVVAGPLEGLRAAAVAVRLQGHSSYGPAVALRANATSFDPTSAGARQGVYYDVGAPNGLRVLGNGDSSALLSGRTPSHRLASTDTTFLLVRREGGGVLVAVAGGVLGTRAGGLPATAELLIVGCADDIGAGDPYLTLSARQGAHQVLGLTALGEAGLGAEYAGRWPLAVCGDDFARADGSLAGQSTPTGALPYALIGTWAIASGAAGATGFSSGTAQLTVTPPARPRFITARVTMAGATKADAGLTFRHNGTRGIQYWSDGTTEGFWDPVNSSLLWQHPWGHTLGQTYDLVVEDNGTQFRFLRDGVLILDWTTIPAAYANDKGAGLILWDDDNGSTYAEWGAWPGTVPVDSGLVLVEAVPDAVGQATFSDAFTDTDGTLLTAHGAGWQTVGTWEIRSGRAQMTAAGATGFAYRAAAGVDACVEADITLPGSSPWPSDWFCGLVCRFTSPDNMLFARLLYQNDSPEIEIWQHVGGSGSLIGFVNLGAGNLAPGSTHTLRLAVRGAEVAAYLDGHLLVQATTALLTGTGVGMGAGLSGVAGQPAWDNVALYRSAVAGRVRRACGGLSGLSGLV